MDANEFARPSLSPADHKNGTVHRSRTREVSSRYRSPTTIAAVGPKRCPSPNARRPSSISTLSIPSRAISAERKRPSRPSSPTSPSPSTPIKETNADILLASRKTAGGKLPESLWPSTMRSLSVSFQSDSIPIPVSRREKPVSHNRTLRPSSNVVSKKDETFLSRKATPERKRSPLQGKNTVDQYENSKPIKGLNARIIDQHRWPSRTTGKVASPGLNRSVDLTDKGNKSSSLSVSETNMPSRRKLSLDLTDKGSKSSSFSVSGTNNIPSRRRLSLDWTNKPLEKSASDLLMQISRDDETSVRLRKAGSANLSDVAFSLPTSRHPSPSVSRRVSPSQAKVVTPSSRGPSPARVRPSSPLKQPQSSTSVLSFIADIKGKKAANHIEDVHQLRLLYNRHLQWRYINAQADDTLCSQKAKAEKILYSVWQTIVDIWDSVIEKRIHLQEMKFKLMLKSVLENQLTCLDEWALIERDHINSLTCTIQDLQASTIRIPITGGAKGEIETVKAAVCSAVDVMQAMGSSVCSTLSRLEAMNSLVSELADVATQERAMLDECESLLSSATELQLEENSLRTQLLQIKQAYGEV